MDRGRRNVLLGAAGITALALVLRLPYAHFPVLNLDETIYAVIAREILRGGVPYRDVWEIKPPLVFYLYALVFWVFGEISLAPVHVLGAIVAALTALVAADIARKERGNVAGLLAGLGMAAYSTAAAIVDVQSAETELFLLFPLLLSVRIFLRLNPDKAYRDLFLSGFFVGAAGMFKQPAAGSAILMAVWILVYPPLRRRRIPSVAVFVAGAALLPVLFVLYFSSKGALWDFFNLTVINNFSYMRERGRGDMLEIIVVSVWKHFYPNSVLWLSGFGLALCNIISSVRNRGKSPAGSPALFLSWFLIVCAAGAFAGVYFNGHYYLLMAPGLVILWSLAAVELWSRFDRRAYRAVLAALLVTGVAYPLYFFHIGIRDWFTMRQVVYQGEVFPRIGEVVRSKTRPEDRIFVWGLNPEIYFFAQRRPASRFIYNTFQLGLVANAPAEYQSDSSLYSMPESWDLLMKDLESNMPPLIVDASQFFNITRKYPLENEPRLQPWLNVNYILKYRIDKYLIYARRDYAG